MPRESLEHPQWVSSQDWPCLVTTVALWCGGALCSVHLFLQPLSASWALGAGLRRTLLFHITNSSWYVETWAC